MTRRHIRIDLGGGAWARVSPEIQPEIVEALRRMVEAARKQFGGPRIARLTRRKEDGG